MMTVVLSVPVMPTEMLAVRDKIRSLCCHVKGSRRRRSLLSLLAPVVLLFAGSMASAQDKPNIVYLLVDNWGWGDISVQGSTVQTPRIDRFAKEGIRFTNFNVQNQCTPTRSAIHTGRLPIRSGTQKVAAPGEPDGMAPW